MQLGIFLHTVHARLDQVKRSLNSSPGTRYFHFFFLTQPQHVTPFPHQIPSALPLANRGLGPALQVLRVAGRPVWPLPGREGPAAQRSRGKRQVRKVPSGKKSERPVCAHEGEVGREDGEHSGGQGLGGKGAEARSRSIAWGWSSGVEEEEEGESAR